MPLSIQPGFAFLTSSGIDQGKRSLMGCQGWIDGWQNPESLVDQSF